MRHLDYISQFIYDIHLIGHDNVADALSPITEDGISVSLNLYYNALGEAQANDMELLSLCHNPGSLKSQ